MAQNDVKTKYNILLIYPKIELDFFLHPGFNVVLILRKTPFKSVAL